MNLSTIEIPRAGARERAAEYRRAAKGLPPGRERTEFEEIARAYRLAALDETPMIALTPTLVAGGTITRTLVYGRGEDLRRESFLLPKLAVCRPSAAFVYTRGVQRDGGLEMVDSLGRAQHYRAGLVEFPPATFDLPAGYVAGSSLLGGWSRTSAWTAMVPIVPPRHRPNGRLPSNHLVLWEAEDWAWTTPPAPPGDPALLRPVGGDIYAVVATWDLTDLERLVLAGRRP